MWYPGPGVVLGCINSCFYRISFFDLALTDLLSILIILLFYSLYHSVNTSFLYLAGTKLLGLSGTRLKTSR